jgi:hypothetical protein
MALAPNGPLSISQINTEVSSVNSNSLTTLSTNAIPPKSAPHAMSEFFSYAHSLQTVSNVQNYTGNTAAEFVKVTSGSGGFVYGLIEYQLVVKTTTSGSNYVATLYVEETNNGLGSYNGSAMTTGTLYPIQTVTFTQGNWPDSYALDHSVSVTSAPAGTIQTQTLLGPGTGETYAFNTNWDNTTFTLINPTSSTAGEVGHFTTGECYNGTAIYLDTFIWKFIKSGYPTLTAATFNINNEQDMGHTGICP